MKQIEIYEDSDKTVVVSASSTAQSVAAYVQRLLDAGVLPEILYVGPTAGHTAMKAVSTLSFQNRESDTVIGVIPRCVRSRLRSAGANKPISSLPVATVLTVVLLTRGHIQSTSADFTRKVSYANSYQQPANGRNSNYRQSQGAPDKFDRDR